MVSNTVKQTTYLSSKALCRGFPAVRKTVVYLCSFAAVTKRPCYVSTCLVHEPLQNKVTLPCI